MFKRLLAGLVVLLGLGTGSVHAQIAAPLDVDCDIAHNFNGPFQSQPGNYSVNVQPGQQGTLMAVNCNSANSWNWTPGNIQTQSITVTAPTSGAATYGVVGCNANAETCGQLVQITVQVVLSQTPDCSLSASPNPVTSGQTVTFTARCAPPAAGIAYTDLSGVERVSTAMSFTDVAPAVTQTTQRTVVYHGIGPDGTAGPVKSLVVTINPPPVVGRGPTQCTLTADPNPVVQGQSTRLVATCAGGDPATRYQFDDPSGAVIQNGPGNFVVVTPQSIGALRYGVIAFNAFGSQSASTTVNVVPPPPSACALTASPNPVFIGQTATLTAQCTGGGAASSYQFTRPDGTTITQTTPTLSFTPGTPGTYNFSVVATNPGGASPPATAQVLAQNATCTITPSVPNPVQRNASVTLTASCNIQSPVYTWSTASGPVAGGNGPSITVTPAVTTTYTVFVSNASTIAPVNATVQYTVVVATATSISAVTGPTITGTPGRPISRPLQVRVTDAQGNPVPGEPVTWSVVNPGSSPGAFGSNPTLSNAQGIATNTFTLGSDAGGRTLRACLTALPQACVDFQVVAGVSQITAPTAGPITGMPGRPLPTELSVRVSDSSGSPVAGELVNWSVVNPGPSPGTFAASQTGPTDAAGISRNTFTLGSDTTPRTLRACLASLPTLCVEFQVTVIAASGLVAITGGGPLVGAPGRPLTRPLQVRAVNAQGQPVAGELVNWTVVNPGPSPGTFAANQTGPTDASGLTQNNFTFGSDGGGRTLRACLATQPSICVDFVVQSLSELVDTEAKKMIDAMSELAVNSSLTQLRLIRMRLDDLRRRNIRSVIDALRVRVAGQSLPPWSSLASAFGGAEGPASTGTDAKPGAGAARRHRLPSAAFAGAAGAGGTLPLGWDDALASMDAADPPGSTGSTGTTAGDPFERLGFFVNGEIELGRQSSTASTRGFDLRTRGITAGVDYRLMNDAVLGAALGFLNARTDLLDSGGGQGARGYSLSAYGSFVPAQGAYVDFIAHVGGNRYDSRRRANLDGLDYAGNTRGRQYALAITAGADIARDALTINPYARVDHVQARINGFSESGAAVALKIDDVNLKTTILTLGGQVSYTVSTSWGVLVPNARLELQRRAQGSGRIVGAQLVADAAISSQVQLETVDRDYGNFTLGVSAVFPRGVSGFANWERLFGRQGYSNSKLTVGVRFEF